MSSHTSEKNYSRRLEWFLLLAFTLSGCVMIPIPRDSNPPGTRQNITPEIVSPIIPGQTTKEEVLMALGEPDEASEDGSRWAYHWFKRKLTIIGGGFGGVGAIDFDKQYVFNITFDENNLVMEKAVHDLGYTGYTGIEHRKIRIDRYQVSLDDNPNYKKLLKENQINVGVFTSSNPGQCELGCDPFEMAKTPGNEAFSQYIRTALITELNQAQAFSPSADITLTANLDQLEYTCDFLSIISELVGNERYLVLTMTFVSSNGKSLTVQGKYKILKGPSIHDSQAKRLARVFRPAVHDLIDNLFRSPEFPSLIKPLDADRGK
jgi:hypothetical protein